MRTLRRWRYRAEILWLGLNSIERVGVVVLAAFQVVAAIVLFARIFGG